MHTSCGCCACVSVLVGQAKSKGNTHTCWQWCSDVDCVLAQPNHVGSPSHAGVCVWCVVLGWQGQVVWESRLVPYVVFVFRCCVRQIKLSGEQRTHACVFLFGVRGCVGTVRYGNTDSCRLCVGKTKSCGNTDTCLMLWKHNMQKIVVSQKALGSDLTRIDHARPAGARPNGNLDHN